MKASLLRFALLGLLAAGCSKKSDDVPPVLPAPDDVISLQVTGSNLSGLLPRVQISGGGADDGQQVYYQPAYAKDEYYTTASVSKTIAVATVPHYRKGVKRYDFLAQASFTTNATGATTPGQLTVTWLVNGKPSTATSRPPTVTITGTTVTLANAYLATNFL